MPKTRIGHTIELLTGGAEYFAALVEAIDLAENSVHLETYIFDFDPTSGVSSIAVARALVRAAERGVDVKLLVDGVGTGDVPHYWTTEFGRSGVKLRVYSPFGLTGFFQPSRWRRLHRKLCVIDPVDSAGEGSGVAFCGGINLLDDYFDPNHGVLDKPRFDLAVRAKGPLVAAVADAVTLLWSWSEAASKVRSADVVSVVSVLRSGQSKLFDTLHPAQSLAHLAASEAVDRINGGGKSAVRAALVLRDNVTHRSRIERAYRKAIGEAKVEIIIANAYFLPGGKLRKALTQAAKRGVSVTLLLQGRYEYFMQWHAARPIYASLLTAGVKIVEYESSFLHAKVAVIDADGDAWATVGSSNLDPLSLLMAREANVVIQDQAFANELRAKLQHAIAHDGQQVDAQVFLNRSWLERGLNWFAYAIMRGLLWVMGKKY